MLGARGWLLLQGARQSSSHENSPTTPLTHTHTTFPLPLLQVGEWDSVCTVTGYGMPSLRIRPKTVSRHGRQLVYEAGHTKQPIFNIGKVCVCVAQRARCVCARVRVFDVDVSCGQTHIAHLPLRQTRNRRSPS